MPPRIRPPERKGNALCANEELGNIRERYLRLYTGAIADMVDKSGHATSRCRAASRPSRWPTGLCVAIPRPEPGEQGRGYPPSRSWTACSRGRDFGLGLRRKHGLRSLGRDHVHRGARTRLHGCRRRRRRAVDYVNALTRCSPGTSPRQVRVPLQLGDQGPSGSHQDRKHGYSSGPSCLAMWTAWLSSQQAHIRRCLRRPKRFTNEKPRCARN